MVTIVRARAPLRLGLAGGGTDVAPFCDVHGGYVLNATIDRYAHASIRVLQEPQIRFNATDLGQISSFDLEDPMPLNGVLDLHKAVFQRMMREFNGGAAIALELTTYCDAPAGSGLGSSSTLVVVIIRAFVELLNLPLDDYAVAQLAFQIERIDCSLQGGRQDQYSATFGGFNFMEFYENGRTVVNPLRIKNWVICELEASMVLFYIGVSRESARIIADQSNNVQSGNEDAIAAMLELKREAVNMKDCLLKGDFDGIVESLLHGWASKKRSAKTVSNPLIEEIYRSALASGAMAGKVSGAGGGGHMIFFVKPERRIELIRSLQKFNGQINNCNFTKFGTQAWRIQ